MAYLPTFMIEDLHIFVYGTLKPGEANFVGVASEHEHLYCSNKVVNSQRAYSHLPPITSSLFLVTKT
jgi:gamma-glutamylcyclotransferase (GGCT)/AIG2-like uncharacterized protein YtfP